MTTESPQAAPSTPAPETPADPAEGAAAGQRDEVARQVREFAEQYYFGAGLRNAAVRGYMAGWDARDDEIARLRAEVERVTLELALAKQRGDDYCETSKRLDARAEQAESQLAKVADLVAAAQAYRAMEQDDTPRMWRGKELHELGLKVDEALAPFISEERSGR